MAYSNKYTTPFSGAGVFDLSNISVGHTVTCTRMRGFFIIPTRGRAGLISGYPMPVASEQELAWLVVFISADLREHTLNRLEVVSKQYRFSEALGTSRIPIGIKRVCNGLLVCAFIISANGAKHNSCVSVAGVPDVCAIFIIDTPIPSWIGLRDKKASGFIPVCALVPVFYVSHDICLTYIIIWVGRMAPVSEVRTQITGGSIPSLSTMIF